MELRITNISKKYSDKNALTSVTTTIESGGIYLLLGKNGAGKSTLLNIIAGNITPDSGEIRLLNKNKNEMDLQNELVMLYQYFDAFSYLKVKELIDFFHKITRLRKERTDLYINLGIGQYENSLIGNLSGGEKKAVAIYLTFLLDKSVIVLDEPFSELDVEKKSILKEFIRNEANHDKLLIVVSHEIREYSDLFTHVLVLHEGLLLANSTTKDFLAEYKNESIPGIEGAFYMLTGTTIEVN